MPSRRVLLAAAAAALAEAPHRRAAADATPILLGVSGPLTGPAAQYGAQWRRGFDLALARLNTPVLRDGRALAYVFEDSQNEPRQAVAIAQKFAADKRIVAELGDFSSTTSMAASPVYQRNRLVQLGFTNSNPNFTKGGDYMWSPGLSQAEEQPQLAALALGRVGLKRPAVLALATDWGRNAHDLFTAAASAGGIPVVAREFYLPDERDFRAALTRLRAADPDGLVLESYDADGALIARQAREQGFTKPIVAVGAAYSPKLIELGGAAVEGLVTETEFFPTDPRPEVAAFVTGYRTRYGEDPGLFAALAYDAMILSGTIIRQFGADRAAFRKGLEQVRDVPSVIFGKITLDPLSRRVAGARMRPITIRGGQFVALDGG